MATITERSAQRYAAAVIRVLAEDFASELNAPHIEGIVVRAICQQAQNPEASFEVIIDDPVLANWRLKPNGRNRRRVRLACYRLKPSGTDREREKRINTALAAIPED